MASTSQNSTPWSCRHNYFSSLFVLSPIRFGGIRGTCCLPLRLLTLQRVLFFPPFIRFVVIVFVVVAVVVVENTRSQPAMYGDKGPPKGYSVPRYEAEGGKMHCQLCSSGEHWTFACPQKQSKTKTTARPAVKLSRSQMLKYGISRKRTEFEPEPTEREQFDAEIKQLEKVLVKEVREEARAAKKQKTETAPSSEETATASQSRKVAHRKKRGPTVKEEPPEEGE